MSNVLIVDPERDAHPLQEDCCLSFTDTVGEATRLMFGNSVGPATPDLVATEAVLPDGNAQDVIRLGNERVPAVPVVVCSAKYTSETVFDAIAAGAFDCLPKPLSICALQSTLSRVSRVNQRRHPPGVTGDGTPGVDIVAGSNPAIIQAYRTAASSAPTGANVLIRGQSGTGKEMLARSIHDASGRRGAFVAVNCAAVMDSLAESELFGHERGAFTGASDRRKGCFELADSGRCFWMRSEMPHSVFRPNFFGRSIGASSTE